MLKPASLLLGAICTCSVPAAFATTINYSDFSDKSDLQLNGSAATVSQPAGVLRLTDHLWQSGSAFYKDAIELTDGAAFDASFSTFFSFQIGDPNGISDADGSGADGIAFLVQTVSNTAGGSGGGIGYAGLPRSVAIEFDTYNNGGGDDHNGNHVGIAINGNTDSIVQTAILPRMNNGDVWYSWIDYNGATDLLEVRLAQANSRPAAATLFTTIDLPGVLLDENAFVGFTSGTGSASGDHDILSWTFESDFAPIGTPEPGSTLALLGLGVAGLFGLSRKRSS